MFGTDTQKQMHMPKKFECSFKNLSKKMEKKGTGLDCSRKTQEKFVPTADSYLSMQVSPLC